MNSATESGFAEILRRDGARPACGGGRGDDKDYDLGLHIMALFVVLFQSALACAFPLIAKRFPALRIPPVVLFLARHFGTGVLIATAFVHLLPTAFISLLDPCLPAFWTEKYPAMPGAIAMAAVFFVTTIEMVFTRGQMKEVMAAAGTEEDKRKLGDKIKGVGKDMGIKLKTLTNGKGRTSRDNLTGAHGQANVRPTSSNSSSSAESGFDGNLDSNLSMASGTSENIGGVGGLGKNGFGMVGRRRSRSLSISKGMRDIEAEQVRRHVAAHLQRRTSASSAAGVRPIGPSAGGLDTHDEIEEIFGSSPNINQLDSNAIASPSVESAPSTASMHSTDPFEEFERFGHSHHHGPRNHHNHRVIVLTHAQKLKRAKLQVMLLEMGILFHSVFIGMALSVTSGSSFIVLLIAILFHQTFEGLALGARIAVIPWESSQGEGASKIIKYQPWLMACAYGLTTPIGQAIGLGLQKVYDPASQTGLILVGTMNAVSSGLLLYAGLVELLAEDFLSDESWVELRGRKRVIAAFCVLGGAAGMALIGAWA